MCKRTKKKEEGAEALKVEVKAHQRRPLTPVILGPEDYAYPCVEELKHVVENTDCKNIALTGVYGSGKSSVINTYLASQTFCKKPLKISLSTFVDEKGTESKPEDAQKYNADIEYKIVQHILYKSNPDNIRQTRFDRIHHKSKNKIRWLAVCSLLALIALIVLVEPVFLHFDSIYTIYTWLLGYKIGNIVNIIGDLLAVLYLLFCVGWGLYKLIGFIFHVRVNKVQAKGIEMEFSKNSSVFNQLLDEVIYFFNANKYDLVVFEDLDRLHNSNSLFLKLRELNMLINESDTFHKDQHRVRFVYAIRDDVFTKDLRTKCFDYIIPIAPVVDHFNSYDYLLKHKRKIFDSINDGDIKNLGVWIKGFRELNNILNEFSLYKKLLMREGMSEQKLLATIIYKNLYPKDYSGLHEKKGLVYSIFETENRNKFTNLLIKLDKEKVLALKAQIANNHDDIIKLRKEYLDYVERENKVKTLYIDDDGYSLDEVAKSDTLFDVFRKNAFTDYYFVDVANEEVGTLKYNIKFEQIEDEVGHGLSYDEVVIPKLGDNANYEKELDELTRRISNVEKENLSTTFNKIKDAEKTKQIIYDIAKEIEIGEDEIDLTELIYDLILKGYLDSDYHFYITFYHEGSLLESDFKLLNYITQGIAKPYDTKILQPASVVDQLGADCFTKPSILNFSILDYLLSDDTKDGLLYRFILVARTKPDFIVDYCRTTNQSYQFLQRLYKGWKKPIKSIRAIKDDEVRNNMLVLYFFASPTGETLRTEEKEFIADSYSFIHQNITRLDLARLGKLLDTYKIRFNKLITPTEENQVKLLELVRNKSHYGINYDNLRVIAGKDFDTKSFTSICYLSNQAVNEYLIDKHINDTIKTFSETSCDEDLAPLIKLLNQRKVNEDWLDGYIAKQNNQFDSLNGIVDSRQYLVLTNDKLKPTWNNALDYYKFHPSFDEVLTDYIKRNYRELENQKCEGESALVGNLKNALFCGNVLEINVYKALLKCFNPPVNYSDFSNLYEERIIELIECKWIEYSADALSFVYDNYSEETSTLFIIKYFDEIDVDDEVDWNDYESNYLGIKLLQSDLLLDKKIRYIDDYANLDESDQGASLLAGLICSNYVLKGFISGDSRKNLLVKAIVYNKEPDSWRDKITLINLVNAYYGYDKSQEKTMLESLGGMYLKLNSLYGRAHFDINEENRQLLNYLKEHKHYVSNVTEEDGQLRVSFLSIEQ